MSTLSLANIETKAANTPPVIKDSNGTEVGQFCRAWVNFNGQNTVAIRDSFNVSAITDNNVGWYSVNFTNSTANNNYCTVVSASTNSGYAAGTGTGTPVAGIMVDYTSLYNTTSKVDVRVGLGANGLGSDLAAVSVNVAVFGG